MLWFMKVNTKPIPGTLIYRQYYFEQRILVLSRIKVMSNTALDKVYNVLGCCKIMNDYVFFFNFKNTNG